ncbi:MAG: 4-diphosphocytidyl-2C-methyl-D-erythritol kinase [Synergistaceae bacterium]|nr:4-diphosphocytidyl-2C-methyl-D-erythritol kinase [Synergistaceae bacterium]
MVCPAGHTDPEVKVLKKTLISPIKINVTLRVLSQRPDGYHEIISLFWKKKGIEGLTIQPHGDENKGDILETKGIKIEEENIISRTLKWARSKCQDIPPLHMCLKKEIPTGSGVGAGSGNAAVLLRWLKENYGLEIESGSVSQIGADVPFLAGDADLAIVSGLGEKMEPLSALSDLRWLLVFPRWRSDTLAAYNQIDRDRKNKKNEYCSEEYRKEILTIFEKLISKEKIGLLHNDFLDALSKRHIEYRTAFKIAEKSGSLAWGLSGSGSALFMIFGDGFTLNNAKRFFEREEWVIKITELE